MSGFIVFIVIILLLILSSSVKIVKQYERGWYLGWENFEKISENQVFVLLFQSLIIFEKSVCEQLLCRLILKSDYQR